LLGELLLLAEPLLDEEDAVADEELDVEFEVEVRPEELEDAGVVEVL
jgi:hypothetical protein